MEIGITYDLRERYLAEGYREEETAEFDRPDTIEAIRRALEQSGYAAKPIGNLKDLMNRLCKGERWDLVFNIAEGMRGFGREAQVPSLLESQSIPYTFSDPLSLSLTLHKGMAKRVLRDVGLPTPDFAVVESASDAEKVELPFPLFAKPVAEGTGKGVTAASRVCTRDQLKSVCGKLLRQFEQPVLVETYLPGREFTVGIVGSGKEAIAIGTMEITLEENAEEQVYSYTNKEHCEELVKYTLASGRAAETSKKLALAAWRALGCRDGGRVDLRMDHQGKPNVLEINPLPGLHPEHSDLPILCTQVGIGYSELINMIVNSALSRIRDAVSTAGNKADTREQTRRERGRLAGVGHS